MSLTNPQYLKTILMRLEAILITMWFLGLLYNERYQHLEALYKSITLQMTNLWCYKNYSSAGNQKCRTDQWILMYQSTRDHWYGFRFHIQLNFMNLSLVHFWSILKILNFLQRLLKHFSAFQLRICRRLNFIPILQPKQGFTIDHI